MNKLKSLTYVAALIMLVCSHSAFAGFGTLFTTASERKTIDENRYKVKKVKKITTVANVVKETEEIIYTKVTREYKISGISIANNGIDSVWINNKLWQNGDVMDEKIHISVNAKQQKVRLTVRGGKTFYGQSGDTVAVYYKVAVKE